LLLLLLKLNFKQKTQRLKKILSTDFENKLNDDDNNNCNA